MSNIYTSAFQKIILEFSIPLNCVQNRDNQRQNKQKLLTNTFQLVQLTLKKGGEKGNILSLILN